MSKFIIQGKQKLFGTVEIEKSKNAILPIICATVLASSPVCLKDVPEFSDIDNMLDILQYLGAKICRNGTDVVIDATSIKTTKIPEAKAQKLRASVFLLGPLLAKYSCARTIMPGGCKIGARPIDIHLTGFRDLGIAVEEENGSVFCDASSFCGGTTTLRFASVGATENLIMCSVLAHLKTTTIKNCAKEPEIVDLCNFINKMGGKIYGAGTDTIVIVGVRKLNGVSYSAIPDRIVAGTYMVATAMCGGKICLQNTIAQHNERLISILVNLGCEITKSSDNIYISCSRNLKSDFLQLATEPYPGFATDMQSQTIAMLANTNGRFLVKENLFESRFNNIPELVKMGANIQVQDNLAVVYGKEDCYCGAAVKCLDLRGGVSLVLAGLCATGTTIVDDIHFIDRGYHKIEEKLSLLGANIHREE